MSGEAKAGGEVALWDAIHAFGRAHYKPGEKSIIRAEKAVVEIKRLIPDPSLVETLAERLEAASRRAHDVNFAEGHTRWHGCQHPACRADRDLIEAARKGRG